VSAAHLHLHSASRTFVHRGEVARAFRGSPETLRSRHFGNNTDGRFRLWSREKRQGQIKEQDEKEHPVGGKAWLRR
jgi:hypothetical protein